MHLSNLFLFSLVTSSWALPTAITNRHLKRAVLSTQTYSQFQVSSGVGGNALAEVAQNFPVSLSNHYQADNKPDN